MTLLGPDGRPLGTPGSRLLGPDGRPLYKTPEEDTKPTKAQAEEFIRVLEEVATECDCTFPVIREGGAGWDCPACGRHTHVLLRRPAEDAGRGFCSPTCRDRHVTTTTAA